MKTMYLTAVAVLWMALSSNVLALSVGDQVPDLAVPSTSGEPVNLRNVEGWKIVYFYPKSFTGGCTKQACGMRDSKSSFDELGVTVFGVSTDDLEKQLKFKEKYGLPFDILADEDKELSRAFDVLGFAGMSRRETFIISPDGVITDIIDSVSVSTHDKDVAELLAVRIAQRDGVVAPP